MVGKLWFRHLISHLHELLIKSGLPQGNTIKDKLKNQPDALLLPIQPTMSYKTDKTKICNPEMAGKIMAKIFCEICVLTTIPSITWII
jgi:hypothetical protein